MSGIEAKCPTCHAELKKVPERKTKCPSCGQYMYVKSSPQDRVKRLVTEEEAKRLEAEWETYQHKQYVLQQFGVSEEEYDAVYRQMASNHGQEEAEWHAGYKILTDQLTQAEDHHGRKMGNLRLAIWAEKHAQDFRLYLTAMFKEELLELQAQPGIVVGIEIRASTLPGVCDVCQSSNGQRLSVDEALRLMPLPHQGCQCEGSEGGMGYCRCEYRPLLKSDF